MSDFKTNRERKLHIDRRYDPKNLNRTRRMGALANELDNACRRLRENEQVPSFGDIIRSRMRQYISDTSKADRFSDETIRIAKQWALPKVPQYALPDPRVIAIESIAEGEAEELEKIWDDTRTASRRKRHEGDDPSRFLLISCRALMFVEQHLSLYRFDRKKASRRPKYDPPANLKSSPQDEEAE